MQLLLCINVIANVAQGNLLQIPLHCDRITMRPQSSRVASAKGDKMIYCIRNSLSLFASPSYIKLTDLYSCQK